LDVRANISIVRAAVSRLRETEIVTSLFLDPDPQQIEAAREVGAQQVELCTAVYADATLGARSAHTESAMRAAQELRRLREAATLALQYGLRVAAGHNIISRAIFTGLERAVREMREAINRKG
jgi:pyridoxine 5-phosphate synthase